MFKAKFRNCSSKKWLIVLCHQNSDIDSHAGWWQGSRQPQRLQIFIYTGCTHSPQCHVGETILPTPLIALISASNETANIKITDRLCSNTSIDEYKNVAWHHRVTWPVRRKDSFIVKWTRKPKDDKELSKRSSCPVRTCPTYLPTYLQKISGNFFLHPLCLTRSCRTLKLDFGNTLEVTACSGGNSKPWLDLGPTPVTNFIKWIMQIGIVLCIYGFFHSSSGCCHEQLYCLLLFL